MQLFCASDIIGIYPDVTYYWRVRQNKKKSLTQKVSFTKNLKDRIFITKETIKVINSSEKHKELLNAFYAKLTKIDVLQFINELDKSDEEYKSIMFNEVKPFVKTFPECVYENIEDIDKIKLDLFLNGSEENLIYFIGNERLRREEERKNKSAENKLKKDIKSKDQEISKLKENLMGLKNEHEKLKEEYDELKLNEDELILKNKNMKEEIKEIKSTKGWVKYKSKNIYERTLKK